MLLVEDLAVEIDGKPVLRGVNLSIKEGETHILMGPNGSGKTTLLRVIMGLGKYKLIKGKVSWFGKDITSLPPYERAKLGLGIAFQRAPIIRGVTVRQIGKHISNGENDLEEVARQLKCEDLLDRDLNYGFSGGEMKKIELLQLLLQAPRLALIDEPESGVDLDNIAIIGEAINLLLGKKKVMEKKKSGLIITHTGYILEYVNADYGHVMIDGKIVCEGNPRDLFNQVKEHGYEGCMECARCRGL
ncbi:MAG: ABC transporter ATP-binding protein [bacterium]